MNDGFVRAVLLLASGSVFAHGITALALPILTRLYTPSDFGVLAIFASIVSVLSVAACLRLDVAIALPEQDVDAQRLLYLALICAFSSSLLVGAIVWSMPAWLGAKIGHPELTPYFWLVPCGVAAASAFSVLQAWLVRRKAFSLIARTRVAQAALMAGTQISWVMLGFAGAAGLLVGYVANTLVACIVTAYVLLSFKRTNYVACLNAEWPPSAKLWPLLVEYRRFPMYSTGEALCNVAAIQIPILMIGALATTAEAGQVLLAMAVIQAPLSLLGNAIGQVFLSSAPQEFRAGKLRAFTATTLLRLAKAGVAPLALIGIIAPFVFGVLFGSSWDRAGQIVAWMTPWFILQFLVSPISMALHITGHQVEAFALQALGLGLRTGAVFVAAQLPGQPVVEAYAVSGAVFYAVYLMLVRICVQPRPLKAVTK